MKSAEPSNSGGMNWLPIWNTRGRVRARNTTLAPIVSQRWRKHHLMIGRYKALKKRDTGFSSSGRKRRPRIRRIISTGTIVIARIDEKVMANVLVSARGRNILPSCASSKKTGRNETTMMFSEKKSGRPTCFAAWSRICWRSGSDTEPPFWPASCCRSDRCR